MDASGLPALFSQSNPFLAQMGEQSFNLAQQKAQQALQAAQGQEQRAQAMQPLEEAHKQALTRQGNANAAIVEDNRAAQLPAADRMKQAMADYRKKMNDNQAAEEDSKMQRRLQYAEMAAKNKGVLPLEYMNSLPEEERAFYANPQATQRTQALAKAWYDSHPKTMDARSRQEADYRKATEAARIMAESRVQAAGVTKAGGKQPDSPTKLMSYYTKLANDSEEGSAEWVKYMALANNEWQKLQALKAQAAEAALTGRVDPAATQAAGAPVVRGTPTPSAMPGTKPSQWTPPAGWK